MSLFSSTHSAVPAPRSAIGRAIVTPRLGEVTPPVYPPGQAGKVAADAAVVYRHKHADGQNYTQPEAAYQLGCGMPRGLNKYGEAAFIGELDGLGRAIVDGRIVVKRW